MDIFPIILISIVVVVLIIIFILIIVASTSTTSDSTTVQPNDTCTTQTQCPSGYVCSTNTFTQQTECKAGLNIACNTSSDCFSNLVCDSDSRVCVQNTTPSNSTSSIIQSTVPRRLINANRTVAAVKSPVNTVRSPVNTVKSPVNTVRSPVNTVRSPVNTVTSPMNTVKSPVNTVKSPVNTVKSPVNTVRSPVNTVRSPMNTVRSPVNTIKSPVNTVRSPITGDMSYKAPGLLASFHGNKIPTPLDYDMNPDIGSGNTARKMSLRSIVRVPISVGSDATTRDDSPRDRSEVSTPCVEQNGAYYCRPDNIEFDGRSKVVDVCSYSSEIIYLLDDDRIICEHKTTGDRRRVTNNISLQRLAVFGGYLYGVDQTGTVHTLSNNYLSSDEWNWTLVDWICKHITHISTTHSGSHLWVQTADMGYLYDSENHLVSTAECSNVKRTYGRTIDHYLEINLVDHTGILYPSEQTISNLHDGAVSYYDEAVPITLDMANIYRRIAIVNWKPYYIRF